MIFEVSVKIYRRRLARVSYRTREANLRRSDPRQGGVQLELPKRSSATSMDDSLGNTLMIEVTDLLSVVKV